jgi:hypothetical protein
MKKMVDIKSRRSVERLVKRSVLEFFFEWIAWSILFAVIGGGAFWTPVRGWGPLLHELDVRFNTVGHKLHDR